MTRPEVRQMLCPVALHPDGAPLRLPVIGHENGSLSLVQCIETARETRAQTAANTLHQQTGLETRNALFIGHDERTVQNGALWHFYLCRIAPPVRPLWQHLTPSGAVNRVSWLDLSEGSPALGPLDAALCASILAKL